MEKYPMTPEGHLQLKEELMRLKTTERPRIIKEIVCGKRRAPVYRKFPNAGVLSGFMKSFDWPEAD